MVINKCYVNSRGYANAIITLVRSVLFFSDAESNNKVAVIAGMLIPLFILGLIVVGVLLYRRLSARRYVSDYSQDLLSFHSQVLLPASDYFLCQMYEISTCLSKQIFEQHEINSSSSANPLQPLHSM